METKITKVVVGVIIWKDNKVLIIKRKGGHGSGEYAFLGGHLEYMESFEGCVYREVMEETNVSIKDIEFIGVSNVAFFDQHYILLGFQAKWANNEAKIMEPDKCDYIGWHDIDNIPQPLFGPSKVVLDLYNSKKNYHDKE